MEKQEKVQKQVANWYSLADYYAIQRVEKMGKGENVSLNSLKALVLAYKRKAKTAEEIGFTPYFVGKKEAVFIETL